MMTSSTPVDDAQRQEAVDPSRSFIVQAPAGSGKTELLIQRYLRLLATVGDPEEIIAITFTRKAAAEMRARVLSALRTAEVAGVPRNKHQQRTRDLAIAAVARDRQRRWALKDNPMRLRIQTVDSLCARLIRQMPLSARFGAQLEPVDNAEPLYREAARALLAELEEDNSACMPELIKLLRHLDNNLSTVEDLLMDMLSRRDQWLRHVMSGQAESERRAKLEQGLRNIICAALQALGAKIPHELRGELVELARYAAANLTQQGAKSPIVCCDGLVRLPGTEHTDLDAWRGIANLLLTKGGKWRKGCDVRLGFPRGDNDKCKDTLCKARKHAFMTLLDVCQGYDGLREYLKALDDLPTAHYSNKQWEIMQALFVLLPMAAAHLDVIFQIHAKVDFSGVAQRAQDALGASEQPTDLALRLDYHIRHILIDEFQDTSISQYHLLKKLIAGWEDGDGRTFFAVGDPMQSIYGFREAEVGVFLDISENGIGSIKPVRLSLKANFRSQRSIVDWINATYLQVFPRVQDAMTGAVEYTPCEAQLVGRDGSAVDVHCFIDKDEAGEAERIIELVAQAREQDANGTIAILVRAKHHLEAIIPRLNTAGLRFRAVEIEQLTQRPVVQDLLALTRALCHPADRLSWLAVLRAPWCGITLHDLYALAGDDHHSLIWDLIADENRCQRLTADGQRRLVHLYEALAGYLMQRRRRTLRRQIEGAWHALGGPATVMQQSDLDNAQMYFDLLERLDEGGDLADFAALQAGVAALNAAPDPYADDTCPQIMTIHKAKGLEFDTVIVPGLGFTPGNEPHGLLTWLERVNRDKQTDLLMAPIGASTDSRPDKIYTAIRKLLTIKSRHENARLLYVAATRARRRLHLLGHAKVNGDRLCKAASRSLLACLWPAVERNFTEAAAQRHATPTSEEFKAATMPYIRRFSSNWRLPAPPRNVHVASPETVAATARDATFFWAGETIRLMGLVTHRLLQRIAREGIANWKIARIVKLRPANIAALAALGLPHNELEEAADRIQQALLNTLEHDRGQWLFAAHHTDARAEYAMTGLIDGQLINVKIDRTFVDSDGVRWIIDYKTGIHEGANVETFLRREEERYRPQLACYAALLRLQESRPIKVGLYYPLIAQGWREWSVE
ncbi:MAG: UvrD-helicase domain-containing protein [Pseudomonadota bacterium]|nr:UvrD-helicase domain-containing protein [Pseudomonadota bacterium]